LWTYLLSNFVVLLLSKVESPGWKANLAASSAAFSRAELPEVVGVEQGWQQRADRGSMDGGASEVQLGAPSWRHPRERAGRRPKQPGGQHSNLGCDGRPTALTST